MRAPLLVATDLDGTLVRTDGTISGFTRAVLAELDSRDVPVLFVTARPLRWMDELWPIVGRHGMAVVSNGAIWFDVARRQVRHLWGIDAETGLQAHGRDRCSDPGGEVRARDGRRHPLRPALRRHVGPAAGSAAR